ncbi:MAG: adenosylmethionine--8-amino-7-oxononanoate transaminase, partial [Anaerovoracaceae bacterium]
MNLQGRDVNHVWHPCSQMKDYEEFPPIVMERGEGSYLYDQEGKPYIDIISSWWCNLLGHCNPEINQAIKEQVDQLEHVIFADITHRPAVELTEALVDILPEGLTRFNFSDSGSAAVECALKMAFQYCHQNGHPEKNRLMCLSNGYHGETLGALSVGAMDQYAKIYKPLLIETISVEAPDCYRCPYGEHRDSCSCACFQRMEEAFEQYGRETCGIIVEPLIQGSAGMRIYPPLYLTKLRRLCNSYDVLLIADEIATGFGRTGKMFAFDYVEGSPDILCMSKGLTGGYMPMAITATTEKIYQGFYGEYGEGRAFMHSHTYSGNPLACSAALAVQRILTRENVL